MRVSVWACVFRIIYPILRDKTTMGLENYIFLLPLGGKRILLKFPACDIFAQMDLSLSPMSVAHQCMHFPTFCVLRILCNINHVLEFHSDVFDRELL